MGFLNKLHQHGGSVVSIRRIPFKKLAGCHHDLVRSLATATSASHSIGDNRQYATIDPRVVDQCDLILLVFAVTLVDPGRSGQSVAFEHIELPNRQCLDRVRFNDVLSNQVCIESDPHWTGTFPNSILYTNLHSQNRRLIELRMEHADLDALIDRAGDDFPVDELMMRRLKKRRLALRDEMAHLERDLSPNEPA